MSGQATAVASARTATLAELVAAEQLLADVRSAYWVAQSGRRAARTNVDIPRCPVGAFDQGAGAVAASRPFPCRPEPSRVERLGRALRRRLDTTSPRTFRSHW